MKAQVVFTHDHQPRAALQIGHDDFVVVQCRHLADMTCADHISGDPTMLDVKWMINVTSSTLIHIKVLGRYAALQAAIEATTR